MITWNEGKKFLDVDSDWHIAAADMADAFIAPLFPLVGRVRASVVDGTESDDALASIEALERRLLMVFNWVERVETVWRSNLENEAHKVNQGVASLATTIIRLKQYQPQEIHKLTDPRIRKMVFDLTDGKCVYCDRELIDGGGNVPNALCIEHVIPEQMGGPSHFTNYVPSCRPCNTSKRHRHVGYLIRKMLGKDPTTLRLIDEAANQDGAAA